MTTLPCNLDNLMLAMDDQNPNWPLDCADQQDLRQFAGTLFSGGDRERAWRKLRNTVGMKLFMPCRAAVHAGLLTEPQS